MRRRRRGRRARQRRRRVGGRPWRRTRRFHEQRVVGPRALRGRVYQLAYRKSARRVTNAQGGRGLQDVHAASADRAHVARRRVPGQLTVESERHGCDGVCAALQEGRFYWKQKIRRRGGGGGTVFCNRAHAGAGLRQKNRAHAGRRRRRRQSEGLQPSREQGLKPRHEVRNARKDGNMTRPRAAVPVARQRDHRPGRARALTGQLRQQRAARISLAHVDPAFVVAGAQLPAGVVPVVPPERVAFRVVHDGKRDLVQPAGKAGPMIVRFPAVGRGRSHAHGERGHACPVKGSKKIEVRGRVAGTQLQSDDPDVVRVRARRHVVLRVPRPVCR